MMDINNFYDLADLADEMQDRDTHFRKMEQEQMEQEEALADRIRDELKKRSIHHVS